MPRPARPIAIDSTVFLKPSPELTALLRSLKKANQAAIDVLEKGLESTDERVRVTCAKQLLDFYLATLKEANNDKMQRVVAHLKYKNELGGGLGGSTADDDENDIPELDFENVQEV